MLGLFSKNAAARGPRAGGLKGGLAKTRSRLSGLFRARTIDSAPFEELETALHTSDAAREFVSALLD